MTHTIHSATSTIIKRGNEELKSKRGCVSEIFNPSLFALCTVAWWFVRWAVCGALLLHLTPVSFFVGIFSY